MVGSYVATNMKIERNMTVTCSDGELEVLMGKGMTSIRLKGQDKMVLYTREVNQLISILQAAATDLAKLYEATKETDQEATNPVS